MDRAGKSGRLRATALFYLAAREKSFASSCNFTTRPGYAGIAEAMPSMASITAAMLLALKK